MVDDVFSHTPRRASGFIAIVVLTLVSAAGTSVTPFARQRYVAPAAGWLFVADSNRDDLNEGRILLVDPSVGRIAGTLRTGGTPDFVLAPDGQRLYIASFVRDKAGARRDELAVVDTATGETIRTIANPDRWISTLPIYSSRMAMSVSGNWLFQLKHRIDGATSVYLVDVFDARKGAFAKTTLALDGCASGLFTPPPTAGHVAVLCTETGDARLFKFSDATGELLAEPIQLTASRGPALGQYAGAALASADTPDAIAIVTGDGRVSTVDAATRQVVRTDDVDGDSRKAAVSPREDWLGRKWIRQQPTIVSRDGTQLFIGISSDPDGPVRHMFDHVAVIDARTFRMERLLTLSSPAFSIALSADGSELYAVDAERAVLTVLDTRTGAERRRLTSLGVTPLFAVPMP